VGEAALAAAAALAGPAVSTAPGGGAAAGSLAGAGGFFLGVPAALPEPGTDLVGGDRCLLSGLGGGISGAVRPRGPGGAGGGPGPGSRSRARSPDLPGGRRRPSGDLSGR